MLWPFTFGIVRRLSDSLHISGKAAQAGPRHSRDRGWPMTSRRKTLGGLSPAQLNSRLSLAPARIAKDGTAPRKPQGGRPSLYPGQANNLPGSRLGLAPPSTHRRQLPIPLGLVQAKHSAHRNAQPQLRLWAAIRFLAATRLLLSHNRASLRAVRANMARQARGPSRTPGPSLTRHTRPAASGCSSPTCPFTATTSRCRPSCLPHQ